MSSGAFYPRRSMTARARLAYYATRFPLAEVATTYRFPPTPEVAAQWAERTPPGFTFDVRAWSLFTGAPTLPDSLWPDLQSEVRDRSRDLRRLYPAHLSPDALDECWARFDHALRPLHAAGKLGVVVLQYPGWFTSPGGGLAGARLGPGSPAGLPPGRRTAQPEMVRGRRLRGDPRRAGGAAGWPWSASTGRRRGPRASPGVAAATADVAVVRFLGRREVEGETWTAPYRYAGGELGEWVPRLTQLASSAQAVHVLLDNCWGSDAVDNAMELAALLRGDDEPVRRRRAGEPDRTPAVRHAMGPEPGWAPLSPDRLPSLACPPTPARVFEARAESRSPPTTSAATARR